MEWLKELIDEYPAGKSDRSVRRLVRVFSEFSDDVMMAATNDFLLNSSSKFFPRANELRPFVESANRDANNVLVLDSKGREDVDDWLLKWEQECGLMPSLEAMDDARKESVKLLDSWGSCGCGFQLNSLGVCAVCGA